MGNFLKNREKTDDEIKEPSEWTNQVSDAYYRGDLNREEELLKITSKPKPLDPSSGASVSLSPEKIQ